MSEPLWQPDSDSIEQANVTHFAKQAGTRYNINLNTYDQLHRWSVENSEAFWQEVWQFCDVRASKLSGIIVQDKNEMPGSRWFTEAELNFTENLLRKNDETIAIISRGENKPDRSISYSELNCQVNRLARAFRELGIEPGDRIVAYMPNIPETVICVLAAAACGAVWSSCSPDFGAQGVIDRFGQVNPKILISVDGYTYNGKKFDISGKLKEILENLPSLEKHILVPYLDAQTSHSLEGAVTLEEFVANYSTDPIEYPQLPFNHPLYILFSSGTTGKPKCIVHGVGGTLIQHLKEHRFHVNLKHGDKLFFFTTCGWMMWNWLVTALASEITIVLYEGSPFHPKPDVFFDYVEQYGINHLGISAKFIDFISKSGVRPIETHDLSTLRTLMSTGSPLNPEGFDYVYDSVKKDICLASISGGTDLISCFVLGNPTLPVWRGEIQCRGLGMDIAVFDDSGKEVPNGTKGELVCRNSFPSMPVGFWQDENDSKYRAAYFERFPGNWHHGDYVELTVHGGMIVYGRSDAVLNPSGVRIGTAEIYRQAEQIDEVIESLVIGQRWDGDTRVVLFVRLREGLVLDHDLQTKIRSIIRTNASPRHVPAKIIQVADIPRTRNGKITEVAVRKLVHGESIDNLEALDNPEALDLYRNIPELQTD
ncbi:MAG: acetoacetate--CoA ligase [Gammaproteobacteria bacterium]|nr:acetoacetate--CoA ligase [Gammaproteobacteria bacterium]